MQKTLQGGFSHFKSSEILRGSINACVIKVPGFGDNKKNYLKDIAMLTGGEVVSDELGKPLSNS